MAALLIAGGLILIVWMFSRPLGPVPIEDNGVNLVNSKQRYPEIYKPIPGFQAKGPTLSPEEKEYRRLVRSLPESLREDECIASITNFLAKERDILATPRGIAPVPETEIEMTDEEVEEATRERLEQSKNQVLNDARRASAIADMWRELKDRLGTERYEEFLKWRKPAREALLDYLEDKGTSWVFGQELVELLYKMRNDGIPFTEREEEVKSYLFFDNYAETLPFLKTFVEVGQKTE